MEDLRRTKAHWQEASASSILYCATLHENLHRARRVFGRPKSLSQILQRSRRGRENHSQFHQDRLDFASHGLVNEFRATNVAKITHAAERGGK
jgi:hypothetical protein